MSNFLVSSKNVTQCLHTEGKKTVKFYNFIWFKDLNRRLYIILYAYTMVYNVRKYFSIYRLSACFKHFPLYFWRVIFPSKWPYIRFTPSMSQNLNCRSDCANFRDRLDPIILKLWDMVQIGSVWRTFMYMYILYPVVDEVHVIMQCPLYATVWSCKNQLLWFYTMHYVVTNDLTL